MAIDRVIDEFIFKCTHNLEIDWLYVISLVFFLLFFLLEASSDPLTTHMLTTVSPKPESLASHPPARS